MTKKEIEILLKLLKNNEEFREMYNDYYVKDSSLPSLFINEDMYDEICDYLGTENVYLFGIT